MGCLLRVVVLVALNLAAERVSHSSSTLAFHCTYTFLVTFFFLPKLASYAAFSLAARPLSASALSS